MDALTRSNQALIKILNSLESAVYVSDIESNKILFANEYVHQLFGDVVGKICWKALQWGVEGVCESCPMLNLSSGKGVESISSWEQWNEGSKRWYVLRTRSIRWIEGKRVLLVIASDVTERMKAEEELKMNIKKMGEAGHLKDLFTDIIRHDLLNPAGIIGGVVEAMLLDSPKDENLHLIRRTSLKLVEIIESASMLSMLESSEELNKKRLNLKEVIDSAISASRPLFEESGMDVENHIQDSLPIKANSLIENVFYNILSNATKYAREGKKVVIEAFDQGDSYLLNVIDYGPGIPDKDKEAVFARFTRRQKSGVKGSGLGLAIARRIVELHKGRIWVEDNPIGGCIFVVELPRA